jgi:hypothetical protein
MAVLLDFVAAGRRDRGGAFSIVGGNVMPTGNRCHLYRHPLVCQKLIGIAAGIALLVIDHLCRNTAAKVAAQAGF